MNIVTLTLNPAFDTHVYVEDFKPYHENIAEVISCDAGGKGVNISRALASAGIPSVAFAAVGEDNARAYLDALRNDSIEPRIFTLGGRIRENITLHADGAAETRISFKGFCADDGFIGAVSRELCCVTGEGDILTFTGRAPDGVSRNALKKLIAEQRSRGVKVVIDSRSLSAEDIFETGAWLIKPNLEEIRSYSDIPVTDPDSARRAAKALSDMGIDNVMISLGSMGAVLSCNEGSFYVEAPSIASVSTIGAGDSSIAGFIYASQKGLSGRDALRMAVAFGSAACLTSGTRPPKFEDIISLYEKI